MTLIKKRDVKEHFAARRRTRLHPFVHISQPDATGFSRMEPEGKPTEFAEDFLGEHSSAGEPTTPSADEGAGAL
jgi:hypothetical protein